MSESSQLLVATGTHIGLVHHTNEDSFSTFSTEDGGRVLLICDGMGGMGRGDEASAIAVEVIEERVLSARGFPPERMRSAVMAADVEIRRRLSIPGNTPGSTAVMIYVDNGMAHVCWAGDSRAYLVRDHTVLERTRDHKLVNELVDAGELTEEEAKHSSLAHMITKALGGRGPAEPTVQPDTIAHPWKLLHNDHLVLCSDGLCDLVDDAELALVLDGREPAEAVAELTKLALDRGGHDNITVIVARWTGPDFNEDDKQTPVITGRDYPARPISDTWTTPDEDLSGPVETPYNAEVDAAETVPPPPERPPPTPAPPPAAPRPSTDEEKPNLGLAIGIGVAAVLLILLAILFAQGVFTGAEVGSEVSGH